MRSLPKPGMPFQGHFENCARGRRDHALQARLLGCANTAQAASVQYDQKGITATLFTLAAANGLPATTYELSSLYDDHMARAGTRGRPIYDAIMVAPHGGLCPLCGGRFVSTLDHYLPKQTIPELALAPINLIPACADCNKTKHDFMPAAAAEQFIHPYYDHLPAGRWLSADVDFSIGAVATVVFAARPPQQWDPVLRARVTFQFDALKLAELYSAHAAQVVAGIKRRLKDLDDLGGTQAVRDYLAAEATSYAAAELNSWKTATYEALANSAPYCGGGFAEPLPVHGLPQQTVPAV